MEKGRVSLKLLEVGCCCSRRGSQPGTPRCQISSPHWSQPRWLMARDDGSDAATATPPGRHSCSSEFQRHYTQLFRNHQSKLLEAFIRGLRLRFKDHGALVDHQLNMSKQCAAATAEKLMLF